jgi:hypothetical protein
MTAPLPQPDDSKKLAADNGVRLSTLVCMASAMAAALPLLARGMGSSALMLVIAGLVLPLTRVRVGHILYLLVFLWIMLADRLGVTPFQLFESIFSAILSLFFIIPLRRGFLGNPWARLAQPEPILDVFFCACVLVYLAAYCRLLSVTRNVFPIDRRRRAVVAGPKKATPSLGPVLGQKRSPALVQVGEIARMALGILAVAVFAQLMMVWLRGRHAWRDLMRVTDFQFQGQISDPVWQLLVLIFLFTFVLFVAHGIISHLGHRKRTPEEAALYLQDELWRQTRREQARLNRWLAWAERKEAKRRARQERDQGAAKEEAHP